jgi:predicted RNA-binding protein with PIN domain
MTSARPQVIVVDAANVVGSRPDGWWRDRAGAARRLLVNLAALQKHVQDASDIIVILEGAARAAVKGPEAPDTGTLRIVLAEASGDDTIVAVTADATARSNKPTVTVVTADRGLRQRIESLGATAVGPRWLLDKLDQ